jgi:hypothetical protein
VRELFKPKNRFGCVSFRDNRRRFYRQIIFAPERLSYNPALSPKKNKKTLLKFFGKYPGAPKKISRFYGGFIFTKTPLASRKNPILPKFPRNRPEQRPETSQKVARPRRTTAPDACGK